MNKYDKYKDSGIDWVGEFPEHWDIKKLKYVSKANPSNIDKKSQEGEQEVFLCNYLDVYNNDFISNQIDFMKATASKNQIEKFLLKKGDVIVTKDSETPDDIGIPAFVVEDFDNVVCGYHLTHIKPTSILGKYLFRNFQCKFLKSYFEVSANGITRYGLGVDELNSSPIIIPPENEQTAIADYLDCKTAEINELIKQKKKLLLLFEEEKTAIINQAVTKGINPDAKMKDSGIEWLGEIPEHWEVKKLKYVAKINPTKDSNIDKNSNELVVFLPMEKVKETGEIDCEIKRPIKEVFNGFTYFRKNDVIIAKITPCFENGKGAFLEQLETEFGFGSTEFHVLRANELINSKYLYFLTRSELFMKIGEAFMTGAAGQKRVPTEFVSEFQFPIPVKKEQQQIASYIESEISRIDKKKEYTLKQIELLKEYKQALISEVVTGKVKVT